VVKHKHRIIPQSRSESDDRSNLVELSIEEHAEAHRLLWEKHDRWQDRIAWQMLSVQISNADGIKQVQSEYMFNRVISDETKSRMSDGKRKDIPKVNILCWVKSSPKHPGKKMSDSHKGQDTIEQGLYKNSRKIERRCIAQYKIPIYECDVCGKTFER
jgi:hypothetical protein